VRGRRYVQKLFDYFSRQSKFFNFTIAFTLVITIGITDYVTGTDFSVLIYYVVPVFIATWFISASAGFVISISCVVAWALADRIFLRTFTSAFIPYWNLTMYLGFLFVTTYFLRLLKTSLEQERQVARTDFLTRAVSRRHFLELAESEINRARRYTHPFTAVYIDIDNFKTINDTFGHDIGDELLIHVVATIKDQVRTSDIVARLGGDEFMIFFPETGAETAMAAIDKVRRVLLLAMGKNNWLVTFSFGMVTFATPPWSVDHMIKLTDDLMYEGKKSGKNMIKHEVYRN
jgi:diguanylate cyclase (GGDEF)-like protein